MTIQKIADFALYLLEFFTLVVGVAIIVLLVWILCMYVIDTRQTKHSIRRNYPVVGRLRYQFEHMGEFFRQYFFAMDREELPFNRAQRSWVYRAAKNVDATLAFGSTQPLDRPGTVIFLNAAFPPLDDNQIESAEVVLGPFARQPYKTSSIYNISAMSYGSLSRPAIEALSMGAAKAGIWLNTGEGGLSPYHLKGGCDLVFQIGTAKYGVRNDNGELCDTHLQEVAAHPEVKMFEIKLSQGAKPGKGGILPAEKVSKEIADIRGIPAGEASLSPNIHEDIRNVGELLDSINRIRDVTGKPVGFKIVIGETKWLRDLCELIHQRGIASAPDFISVDSSDGGTGAAPQSLMDIMGMPLSRSLPFVTDTLMEYSLKDRIKVIASGKMVNPAGVAWAIAMGADFVASARGYMFALGCIQALQCNKNTCPTGVATHDPKLQKGLAPLEKSERVAYLAKNMHKELDTIAHSCGVTEARAIQREHAELINDQGAPAPLIETYPKPLPDPRFFN